MSRYIISKAGARIIEGRANGFSNTYLGWAMAVPPAPDRVIKAQSILTNEGLGIGPGYSGSGKLYSLSTNRAVGMCLAAGLMQYKDLKRPGQFFTFTMEPRAGCLIQYNDQEDSPLQTEGNPPFPVRVPKKVPGQKHESMVVNAPVRTHLAAVLLGMSAGEISKEATSDCDRSDVHKLQNYAGLAGSVQLAAHCAVNGVIEVPGEILTDPKEVKPIIYTQPATLELPLGVVAQNV